MRVGRHLVLTSFAFAWAACGGIGEPMDPNHCKDTYCVGGEQTVSIATHRAQPQLDLLVVLDDSVTSGAYAPRLESALRDLARNTKSPVDGLPAIDLNVALLPARAAAMSDGVPPRFWPETPYCPLPSGPFLHAARLCDAPNNFQGDLTDALVCAALHPPSSGQPPQPIEAIRAFLEPGGPAKTSGFRRENAYLALVIVSSQDDPTVASAETLAAYHDFLGTVVEYPDETILGGIVSPAMAQGLSAFAKSLGSNGAFSDITTESWPAIPFVTDLPLVRESFPICLDWPVDDADPNMEGIQADCIASEIHLSDAGRTENTLPRCSDDGSTPEPCWKTLWNTDRCAHNAFEFVVAPPQPACLPSYAVKYSFTCATRLQ